MKASSEWLAPALATGDRAALADRMIDHVFMKLRDEAKGRNGHLTVDDLHELERYLRAASGEAVDGGGDADDSGLAGLGSQKDTAFDKGSLLVSVVRAHLGDVVQNLFAGQLDFGGDRWRAEVFEFLADLLRQAATGDIDTQLYEIYCDLALWKGQELSAREIASDARVVDVFRNVLCAVTCKRNDGSLPANVLCDEFNWRIEGGMPRLDVGLEFATVAQVNKLLESLDALQLDANGAGHGTPPAATADD